MNHTLPPRDRGHRNAPAEWPPRPARIVPCTGGLVSGIAADREGNRPERRKARRGWSRAGLNQALKLLVDAVGSLSSCGLEGFNGVSGLLHRARHEPADRVALPAHRDHNFGERCARRAPEHGDYLRGLAALARSLRGFLRLSDFRGLGRVLTGCGPLRRGSRFRCDVGRLCRNGRSRCGFGNRHQFVWWRSLRGNLPQALKCSPDAADSRLAILKLLDGSRARQAVPDLDQAGGRPLGRQFVQSGFVAETLRVRDGFGVLCGRVNRDVVRLVFNREDFHGVCPL